MKREAAGYYTETVSVRLNSQPVKMRASVQYNGEAWYWLLDSLEGPTMIGGEDWFQTKGDAVAALRAAIFAGFTSTAGLGFCVNIVAKAA